MAIKKTLKISFGIILLAGTVIAAYLGYCDVTDEIAQQQAEIEALREEWTRWRSRAVLDENIVMESIYPHGKTTTKK